MAELTPARKRMAVLIIVIGSALIGERVVALMAGDDEVVAPVSHARRRPRTEPAPAAADSDNSAAVRIDRLVARQQALEADAGDVQPASLFDAVSWQPPAVKEVAAPPPAPVAPPFPYAYLGGLSEDGVRTAFFTQGDRVLPVKAGDTVDAAYRVDQMNEKQMTLTYLPLNQTLTVTLRSGQ